MEISVFPGREENKYCINCSSSDVMWIYNLHASFSSSPGEIYSEGSYAGCIMQLHRYKPGIHTLQTLSCMYNFFLKPCPLFMPPKALGFELFRVSGPWFQTAGEASVHAHT